MTNIIAKTYSVIGNATNAIIVDTIVALIHPISGAYTELTGNIIRGTYEIFHTLLQQQLQDHPPKSDECFFVQQPHRPERTFDNVLYVADDGSLPLSTFTERILCQLVQHGSSIVAIPLLRYQQTSVKETTEAMLNGIRRFQDTNNAPLHIYLTLGKRDSVAWKLLHAETKYCGEWSNGQYIA
ncbi:MAG: hypothetical protein WAV51_02485 [Microgenomates group bacterium]